MSFNCKALYALSIKSADPQTSPDGLHCVTCSRTVAPRQQVTQCPIVQHQAAKWLVTAAVDSKRHVIC
jgi:hypothetical protein